MIEINYDLVNHYYFLSFIIESWFLLEQLVSSHRTPMESNQMSWLRDRESPHQAFKRSQPPPSHILTSTCALQNIIIIYNKYNLINNSTFSPQQSSIDQYECPPLLFVFQKDITTIQVFTNSNNPLMNVSFPLEDLVLKLIIFQWWPCKTKLQLVGNLWWYHTQTIKTNHRNQG